MGLKVVQLLQQTRKLASGAMNNTTQVIAKQSSIMDGLLKIDEQFLDSIIITQAKKGKGIFKGRSTTCTTSELDALETFLSKGRSLKEKVQDKIQDKINKLHLAYPTEATKFTVNGIEKEVLFFKGSQCGSNTGAWVLIPKTGRLGYAKFGKTADHSYSEKIASDLYKLTGAKTPPLSIIKEGRNIGTISSYIPIEDIRPEHVKLLREDFGADCWLANWDALKSGNVGIYKDQAIRMDVGGSLRYRAQGARKGNDFGEDVQELTTFFDNISLSKPYLKNMTREELIKSLKKVTDVNDDDIIKIIDKQVTHCEEWYRAGSGAIEKRMRLSGVVAPVYLQETLIARKNYIAKFLQKCELSPQKAGESIEEYIRRIYSEMPKTEYKIPFEKLYLSRRVGNYGCYQGLTMAETLTPSQKRVYDRAYIAYKTSRKQRIIHPKANEILTTDCMVHATKEESLERILKQGIISSDCRPNVKTATGEDTMTTLSGDFWDIKSEMSIKDYFGRDPQKCAHGELGFLYNRIGRPDGGDLTIVVNKKAVHKDIIEQSFTAVDTASPSAKILRTDDNILPWDYPTHRIVPFGTPANTIDRIIIRTNKPDFNEAVKRIIGKIKASGLDIKLYDTNGKLLWKPI